ncbi:hypothetical protein PoB_005444800 [Plakobranchus ocellatus]|uniref:Uncharacterized protein n=1 Tax=Plakobranchus ocellatus TaxID=259542 RepID=A0AAV4CAD5_9GAST|nr:hypothetical protein PoB_005444800 [Plakobranchus ocellatus]
MSNTHNREEVEVSACVRTLCLYHYEVPMFESQSGPKQLFIAPLCPEPALADSNSNSTSNTESDSDGSMMKGMLAGLGGFVGLIVFICLLWCCCCTDGENSCKCSANCLNNKNAKKNGHPYEDHGPGHDPARPPRHARDKSKVNPSPPPTGGNLRAPSQWSHTR